MDINKKIALITGAAQGLGKEIALKLMQRQNSVLVLDIQKYANLDDAYRERIDDYSEVDLADLSEVDKAVHALLQKYQRVDILINNAALKLFKYFHEFDQSEIDRYINVNFRTPIMLISRIYPYMKKQGYGRIINISSFSALSGYGIGSLYCSTKCALNVFTESVGKEMRADDDITINAICPDSFSTLEGEPTPDYTRVVEAVNKAVSDILDSRQIGEVITIAGKKRIILNALYEFRKRLLWLARN